MLYFPIAVPFSIDINFHKQIKKVAVEMQSQYQYPLHCALFWNFKKNLKRQRNLPQGKVFNDRNIMKLFQVF